MEDFVGIVIAAIFVIASALSSAKKKRSRAGRSVMSEPVIQKELRSRAAERVLFSDADRTRVRYVEELPVEGIAATCDVHSDEKNGSAETDEVHNAHEHTAKAHARKKLDLDGRKMIIYSEILRPKYLDDTTF